MAGCLTTYVVVGEVVTQIRLDLQSPMPPAPPRLDLGRRSHDGTSFRKAPPPVSAPPPPFSQRVRAACRAPQHPEKAKISVYLIAWIAQHSIHSPPCPPRAFCDRWVTWEFFVPDNDEPLFLFLRCCDRMAAGKEQWQY